MKDPTVEHSYQLFQLFSINISIYLSIYLSISVYAEEKLNCIVRFETEIESEK